MKYIPLTQGKFAIVDDRDYDRIARRKWHARKRQNVADGGVRWYAYTWYRNRHGKRVYLPMHRYIIHAPPGFEVDHINGDGLDNRRENLRVCRTADNQHNMHARWGRSQYKGVDWVPRRRKWRARITLNGQRIELGEFDHELEAALAYDRAALRLYGKFANLNRPDLIRAGDSVAAVGVRA